jgi:mono/diheme cytochrome c family protein
MRLIFNFSPSDMNKQLPLLGAGLVAGLLVIINSLSAADSPAAPAASGSMAPPAASASMAAPAASGSMAPAAASGMAPKAGPDLSKLPAPSDKKDLAFDADIAPILKASCANCHGGATPRSGLDVTSKDTLLKGGRKGKDIVAGHSDQSLVVLYAGDVIAKEEMPPVARRAQNPALTKDQLALVRAWIDQGAK